MEVVSELYQRQRVQIFTGVSLAHDYDAEQQKAIRIRLRRGTVRENAQVRLRCGMGDVNLGTRLRCGTMAAGSHGHDYGTEREEVWGNE